ncbi:hypothetical protein GRF59_05495 [Paenibacillus sp. HJL G12]|uniref:Holin n=1 Tax=Paenibacillus dendrobii TaxID=2691084 RepID=A0A7X3IGF1_9BACL|nr:hypothetical protein [Paenibacillus dendrobii]MWV43078.1 hypothetical protein [Paenibacillus dendrobii]
MLNPILAAIVTTAGLWILVAGLTESITEILKNLFPEKIRDKVTYTVSIGVGVALAFAFRLNPFGMTGATMYASMVAAGILASRGANYLNSLLKKLGIQ